MQHFHKPTDEKRMVVILDESDYGPWLDAPSEQMPDFLTRYLVRSSSFLERLALQRVIYFEIFFTKTHRHRMNALFNVLVAHSAQKSSIA